MREREREESAAREVRETHAGRGGLIWGENDDYFTFSNANGKEASGKR